MQFIAGVNRLLAAEGFLSGDGDEITTFSDLQHKATARLARIAIQDELTDLLSDNAFPYEKSTTGSITTAQGTRTYTLASDFVRFLGRPMLYVSADNVELYEYKGGEESLKIADFTYKTTQGNPWAWYIEGGTTKQLSFYQVPQSAKTYTYDYEKDVSVTNSTDTLPFHNEIEAQAFCRMAQRRFKYLLEGKDVSGLATDAEKITAKVALLNLVSGKNARTSYAPVYR